MIMKDETVDSLFDETFRLIQDQSGYRFSLDPIILAHFTKIKKRDKVLDLGTGNGIIALLLSKLHPEATFWAIEIQSHLADQALRNSILNEAADRIHVLPESVKNLPRLFRADSFNAVVSNPPYQAKNSGRINPNPFRAKARHEIVTSLETFISVTGFLLKNGGRAYFMLPSSRLAEFISLLKKYHLEPKNLQLLYSSLFSESQHFLIEACKNCRTGLRILPPLILYQQKGIASEALKNIYAFFKQKMRIEKRSDDTI